MSNLGLLHFQSASDLKAEEEAQRQAEESERRMRQVESSLSGHIRKCYESAKTSKREIERRLLDCAKRQKGEYDAEKLRAIREEGGSELYPKLTTTKCRAAAAWIRDILMPSNGRPWGLEPTPVADIPPEYLMMFAQKLGERAQGMDQKQVEDLLRREVKAKARETADRHEELINDQLTEGGWESALEEFIDDFVTYPAAFMRGQRFSV